MRRWLWKFVHNVFSHPLLMLDTQWSFRFHDWTATKMLPRTRADIEGLIRRCCKLQKDVIQVRKRAHEVVDGDRRFGVNVYLTNASNSLNRARTGLSVYLDNAVRETDKIEPVTFGSIDGEEQSGATLSSLVDRCNHLKDEVIRVRDEVAEEVDEVTWASMRTYLTNASNSILEASVSLSVHLNEENNGT